MNKTELDALLRDVSVGKLVCLDADGYPLVVPLVYEYYDGGFYIMSHRPTTWAERVLARGRSIASQWLRSGSLCGLPAFCSGRARTGRLPTPPSRAASAPFTIRAETQLVDVH